MNDFKITPDDPRLTAYALGELEGDESTVVAAAVAADPALQAAVEEIRATAGRLTAALEAEPLPEPAPPLHVATYHTVRPARIFRFPYWAVAGLAAAACLVAMFTLREWPQARQESEQKVAALTKPELDARKAAAAPAEAAPPGSPLTIEFQKDAAGKPPSEPYGVVVPSAPSSAEKTLSRDEAAPPPAPANAAAPPPASAARAETAPAVTAAALPPSPTEAERVVAMQPLEVKADSSAGGGHPASSTLAGTRLAVMGGKPALPARRLAGQVEELNRFVAPPRGQPFNTEAYDYVADNDFLAAAQNPLSTFGIDVDTASYSNVRRFLQGGRRPPRDAVRIEELINYFAYGYAAPKPADPDPIAASLEVASAPWAPTHRLVRIGLKGREVSTADRPAANLVFLLDVSGSMDEPEKLPLVKEAMRTLVEKLKPEDRVAIVTYAGTSGLALPSTPASHRVEILAAIDELQAGGSTNGAMGIQLAYDVAKANFITGGINRVILATDGDFNVGVTDCGDLVRLVGEKAKSGVFLTALGVGMGNYKDATLEQLADKGNGVYAYLDSAREARKVLGEQVNGALATIAKDVKVQVEFNPARVQAYRLLGYEDRLLEKEDFNNDKVDAGDLGAGHAVTALYEVVPVGVEWKPESTVDALKYQQPEAVGQKPEARGQKSEVGNELLTVKVRYKTPDGDKSKRLEFPLVDGGESFAAASTDFKFATAVAGFGLVLRDSPHKGAATLDAVLHWAEEGTGSDAGGYRGEFISLVKRAEEIGTSQG